MVPCESLGAVSYSHSIVTMALSCIISEMKRNVCRKIPSEYFHNVQSGKTRMVWLPSNEKSVMIGLAVLIEYRCVTDRQTDKRTDRHLATAQSALCIALCGNYIGLSHIYAYCQDITDLIVTRAVSATAELLVYFYFDEQAPA